jgi:hypothetical protein
MYILVFLAEALARLWQWLTVRRLLHIAAIIGILALIGQLVAVSDVVFLLGFDWGLALEVSGAIMMLTARTPIISAAYVLRQKLSAAKNRVGTLMRRGFTRARRARPAARRTPPTASSDEDGGFYPRKNWANTAMA